MLSTIVNHIDRDRFDVTVCAVIAEGVYVEQVSRTVKFKPLVKQRKGFLYKSLYNLIYHILPAGWVYRLLIPKGNDVEVAYCEGFATKVLAKSPCPRKIAWVHIDLVANPWTQGIAYRSIEQERKAYSKYSEIICVSDNVRKAFEDKFGIAAGTLYNPIDADAIIEKSREKVALPAKTKMRFVTTGRLAHQKGYDRLLKIVKRLRDEGYDFELWILGDGADREDLTLYINENGLNDHVRLWGFVPNPYPYVAAGDVFVCSSRSEGYSTAATEAIILQLPVITTLCAGMEELLGMNEEYGHIVPNDEMTLYEPLKKALDDKEWLGELKRKAVERSNDFKIETLMQPIERLLQ